MCFWFTYLKSVNFEMKQKKMTMTINLSYLIQVFNLYPLVAYVCGLSLSVGNTDLLRQLGGLPGETVRQNHLKPRNELP